MSRQRKWRKVGYCPFCYGAGVIVRPDGVRQCMNCSAIVRLKPDNSIELHVTGVAAEVESVTRGLTAKLKPEAVGTVSAVQDPSQAAKAVERWSRSRKAWAFAIGLTTIVGGIAAVLALFIH
jgi:hypothetical protein